MDLAKGNTAFSSELRGMQFAWDSTSLRAFLTCPRMYQYSIVEGWTPKQESVHLTFGAVYHSAMERYEHGKAEGLSHDESVANAVETVLNLTWNSKLNKPWQSDHNSKNRETLIRTVVWCLDEFENAPVHTVLLANGQPATELSFKIPLPFELSTGESTLWCGHLDKVVEFGGSHYVLDYKTTTSTLSEDFFDKFTPDVQFTGYTFAGQVAYSMPVRGVICEGIQIAVSFSRVQRQIIARSPEQVNEFFETLPKIFRNAERCAEERFWPMNPTACGNYGGCPFRPICSKPPSIREQWLRGMFHKRIWDPLVSREV